jgi:hypothetical protein
MCGSIENENSIWRGGKGWLLANAGVDQRRQRAGPASKLRELTHIAKSKGPSSQEGSKQTGYFAPSTSTPSTGTPSTGSRPHNTHVFMRRSESARVMSICRTISARLA